MPVGSAGGGAGARVVEHGDQRVGRVPDPGLQVEAVVGERRDGQRALPAGPGRQPRAGETGVCGTMWAEGEIGVRKNVIFKTVEPTFIVFLQIL